MQQRKYLIKAIDSYLEARVDLADQVISDTAREKIRPGDTIVTYARSVQLVAPGDTRACGLTDRQVISSGAGFAGCVFGHARE